MDSATRSNSRPNQARYVVLLLDPFGRCAPIAIHESNTRREAFASAKAWDKKPNGRVAVAWTHWAPLPAGVRSLDDVCENGEATNNG